MATCSYMFLVLYFLKVFSHNWVHGDSRATARASTIWPSPPRTGPRLPHRTVGAFQDFTIEWSSGHGGFYYFISVKATDESKLTLHTEGLLDDYLNNAPQSALDIWADTKYDKTHVSCTYLYPSNPQADGCEQSSHNPGNRYDRPLEESDPNWNDRSLFDTILTNGRTGFQFKYKDADLARDVRAAYENTNYPWIEAVWKFEIKHPWAFEWDAAKFAIPARQGSGEYMIHAMWQGYTDVIDIDVLPAPHMAVDVYGQVPPDAQDQWVKTDHCVYPNLSSHLNNPCHYYRPGEDISDMLQDCKENINTNGGRRECTAVNCVPLHTPANIPSEIQGSQIYDAHVSWGGNDCKTNQIPNWAQDVNSEAIVCYGLVPREPTDPTFNPDVENFWYVRDKDPEDPIYYSTCYRMENKKVFIGNVDCPLCEGNVAPPRVEWQVGDRCLSCADVNDNTPENTYGKATMWRITDECERCF